MPEQEIIRSPNPNTLLLIERLRRIQIGELVEYEELTNLIGINVRQEGSGFLRTARDRLTKDDGVVFKTIPRVGLKRMNSHEIATEQMDLRRRKTRSNERRKVQEAHCANLDELTTEEKRHLQVAMQSAAQILLLHGTKWIEEEKRRIPLPEQPTPPPPIEG